MLVGGMLLALLVCSGNLYLAEGRSIACEAVGGPAAFCTHVGTCPCCRINEEEIGRCWPHAQPATKPLGNFSITKTIGYCPSGGFLQNHGGCVGDAKRPNESGLGHRVQEHSLAISYEAVNLLSYNITVSWAYLNGDPSPGFVSAYSLWLAMGDSELMIPYPEQRRHCVCINSSLNLTQYSFTVDYDHGKPTEPVTATVFTFPHASGPNDDFFQRKVVRTEVPSSCADYQSGLQYNSDTCGLPRYGKPRHVKVQQNGTHTVISWEKPCFEDSATCDMFGHGLAYVDPETYFLTLTYNNEKHYLEVSNATVVVLNTSENLHVKVQAYVPCSGIYEYRYKNKGSGNGCSLPGGVENEDAETTDVATCCPFVSPSTLPTYMSTSILIPTPSLTHSAHSSFSNIVIFIVSATTTVAVLIVLITCTTFLVRRYFRKQKSRKNNCYIYVS